jgi:hypothetical protein
LVSQLPFVLWLFAQLFALGFWRVHVKNQPVGKLA